jgi:hypothetical protein
MFASTILQSSKAEAFQNPNHPSPLLSPTQIVIYLEEEQREEEAEETKK